MTQSSDFVISDEIYDKNLIPIKKLMEQMMEKNVERRPTAVQILESEIFSDSSSRESSAASNKSGQWLKFIMKKISKMILHQI